VACVGLHPGEFRPRRSSCFERERRRKLRFLHTTIRACKSVQNSFAAQILSPTCTAYPPGAWQQQTEHSCTLRIQHASHEWARKNSKNQKTTSPTHKNRLLHHSLENSKITPIFMLLTFSIARESYILYSRKALPGFLLCIFSSITCLKKPVLRPYRPRPQISNHGRTFTQALHLYKKWVSVQVLLTSSIKCMSLLNTRQMYRLVATKPRSTDTRVLTPTFS
jgi:hypothetical protein